MWKQLGAQEVLKVSRADSAAAHAALVRATLVWMPGGFQGLLMNRLAATPIPNEIRKRFDVPPFSHLDDALAGILKKLRSTASAIA